MADVVETVFDVAFQNPLRSNACIALSFMVGIPSGRVFPLALGI
jgi:hypothetical protein